MFQAVRIDTQEEADRLQGCVSHLQPLDRCFRVPGHLIGWLRAVLRCVVAVDLEAAQPVEGKGSSRQVRFNWAALKK